MVASGVPAMLNQVSKLQGASNYTEWKQDIKMAFYANKTFGIIDGSIPKPSEKAEATLWTEKNQEALHIMYSRIDKDYCYITDGVMSGHALWIALESAFKQS